MAVKYCKPRTKKVKPPKPVSPPKPERPKRGDLRAIYKDLLSSDVDQRVDVLLRAMSWFNRCEIYVRYKQEGKWTLAQKRALRDALAARAKGLATPDNKKKEELYVNAITCYEKLVHSYKPPVISKYIRKFHKTRKVLDDRRKRLSDKFGVFLGLLSTALHPKNATGKSIELRVDKLKATHRIDSNGNITFDRRLVLHMRRLARKYGLLSAVLHGMDVLTESAGRTPELDPKGHKTGRIIISARKRYNAFREMMFNLNRFMMTDNAPRRLVRKLRTKKVKPTP